MKQVNEVARYLAGKTSQVQDHGSFGMLNGSVVQKPRSGTAIYNGDYIEVHGGMVLKNGHYVGKVED